jgi:hypothetical protein
LSVGPQAAAAAAEMIRRAAAAEWRGPDPYDGLWWRWPRALIAGRRRRQAIVQLHARSPIDIRRAYSGERPRIAKALALFGRAGLRVARVTGEESCTPLARAALALLHDDEQAGRAAWGYPFAVQTRWSHYRAGSPNVVVTAFAAAALAEAAAPLGESRFAERARRAAEWALDELYLEERGFFAYHPTSDALVHNANLLGARLVHTELGGEAGEAPVHAALERTLGAQRPDGSFPYGDGRLTFTDSFHTGFVLDCLVDLIDVDVDLDVRGALRRGADFYAERFFGGDGAARLWPDRPFPIDAHSAGTGLTTLAKLADAGYADRDLLATVATHTLGTLVRDGRAIFRRYRVGRASVRYVRWCDAHVALGLADAAEALSRSGGAVDQVPTRVD